ncbi:MAG: hypothetical protein ABI026_12135 [Gemmatimonadaceae bacterium]
MMLPAAFVGIPARHSVIPAKAGTHLLPTFFGDPAYLKAMCAGAVVPALHSVVAAKAGIHLLPTGLDGAAVA